MSKQQIDIWGAMKAHQDEQKGKEPDLKHFLVPSVAENGQSLSAEKDTESE